MVLKSETSLQSFPDFILLNNNSRWHSFVRQIFSLYSSNKDFSTFTFGRDHFMILFYSRGTLKEWMIFFESPFQVKLIY